MPDTAARDEATKEMQEATGALRTFLADAKKEEKARGDSTSETKERMDKAEKALDAAQDKWDDWEKTTKAVEKLHAELETKMQLLERHRPGSVKSAQDEAKEGAVLYEKAFSKALRGALGGDRERPMARHQLTEAEHKAFVDFEKKSLSADGGETGGYLMPPAQRGELIRKLIEFDALEELASSVTLTQGDTWEAPREGDQNFACDWTSERGSRAETTAGQMAKETIVAEELYAKPLITQKMLDDPGFDVAAWLTERLARRMRVKRGAAFITGTGAGQPEGITISATAIGSGDFGYVPMGNASAITADGIIDVFFDLPEPYAQGATWLFRRATLKEIRKLQDGNANYLWTPGFEGTPPTILGRPYRESLSMPAIAANAFSVAFGDWADAYLVVRRQEIRVLRDPFSTKPFIEFYTTMRVGGAPVLNEAYRLGKISTS